MNDPQKSNPPHDMNRRQFLGDSAKNAAGVAAAGIVGLSSRASASTSPSERIGLGVIGVRNRGLKLATKFAERADVDVLSVCDIDESKRQTAAEKLQSEFHASPNQLADYRELLDDSRIDAVVIATPDHWHASMAADACLAGKDIYLECPATHFPNEGQDLILLANNTQRVIQTGLQQRSGEHFHTAIHAVRSGEIGVVKLAKAWVSHVRKPIGTKKSQPAPANVDYQNWLGNAKHHSFQSNRFHFNWRWFWDYGSGELGVWGVHLLDIACWGMDVGLPHRIVASGGKFHFEDDQETPDTMSVNFDFGDRAIQWEHRQWTPHGNENRTAAVAFYGTNGTLVVDRGGWKIYDRKESATAPASELLEPHIENFVQCIRSRQTPTADLETAVSASNLCHWANAAYRNGETVSPALA